MDSEKIKHKTLIVTAIGLLLSAFLLRSFFNRETVVSSSVELSNGRSIVVTESVTIGADEWFRPGRGEVKRRSIRFSYDGQQYTWETRDGFDPPPVMIDFLEGNPVLVFRIDGIFACQKYKFPPEGLVILKSENGKWRQDVLEKIPQTLRTNYPPRSKPRLINELSSAKSASTDACSSTKTYNGTALATRNTQPTLETKKTRKIRADFISHSKDITIISTDALQNIRGKWSGSSYVSSTCEGRVSTVRQIFSQTSKGSTTQRRSIGHEIFIRKDDGTEINVELSETDAVLQSVICSDKLVHLVYRLDNETIIIESVDQNGFRLPTTHITLPNADSFRQNKNRWIPLLSIFSHENNYLTITLADFFEHPDSVTITQSTIYEARFPTN